MFLQISDFLYESIICWRYSSELHRDVNAIQMVTHNICLYKEVDKKYTGCYLKTTELLDCVLKGNMCHNYVEYGISSLKHVLYSLEALLQGATYKYLQNMFLWIKMDFCVEIIISNYKICFCKEKRQYQYLLVKKTNIFLSRAIL